MDSTIAEPAGTWAGCPYATSLSTTKLSIYDTLTDEQLLIAELQTTVLRNNTPDDPFEEAALLDTIEFFTSCEVVSHASVQHSQNA